MDTIGIFLLCILRIIMHFSLTQFNPETSQGGLPLFILEDLECTRFDPKEIKATFFDPSLSSILNLGR